MSNTIYTLSPLANSRPINTKSNSQQTNKKQCQGFTVIELLISVTIIGVLFSIAVPSFKSLLNNAQLTDLSSSLHTSLMHARSHAINHQVMVIVCELENQEKPTCNQNRSRYANWQNGWMSYADLNNNNKLDASDNILQVRQAKGQTNIVFNQAGRLRFFPQGSARSAGFYLCNADSSNTRYIRLLYTGRSRSSGELSVKQLNTCLS